MTTEAGQIVHDSGTFRALQRAYLSKLWSEASEGTTPQSDAARSIVASTRAAARLDGNLPAPLATWRSEASAGASFNLELGRVASESVGSDGLTVNMVKALDWDLRARLAAAVRRTVVGEVQVPPSWTEDKVIPIKKDKDAAPRAKGLRYLRQGALLQKIAAHTLRDSWRPLPPWVLGGLARCRPDDIAEVVRACAVLATEWTNPAWSCTVGAADVYRAYDSVGFTETAKVLSSLPPEAGPVFATPLFEGKVNLEGATEGEGSLRPQVGVRTGAVESGMLLAQILAAALGHLPAQWAAKGWAFFPPEVGASCFLWVDNIFVLGQSEEAVLEMIADVGESLRQRGFFFKPSSLEVMRCGRAPTTHGAAVIPGRVGTGPEGEVLQMRRVGAMAVLGYKPQASGHEREELEHHLRQADRAWFGIRRVVSARWASAAARFKALAQRLWPIALPPGCGAWALSKADCQALRAWELDKIRKVLRIPHPRSTDDAASAHRRLEIIAGKLSAMCGEPRLLDRYFGSVHARASNWAKDRNAAQPMWRWCTEAGDVAAWRALAPTMHYLDRENRSAWRRSAPGRPRVTWAELVTELTAGGWTIASRNTLPACQDFVLAGLRWAGAPANRHGAHARSTSPGQTAARANIHTLIPWPDVCVGGELLVQTFTDAQILANAMRGQAVPPPSACASLALAGRRFWHLRVKGGVAWPLGEPVMWIPRELNQAADHLATMAAPHGHSRWFAPDISGHVTAPTARLLAFSDGSSSEQGVGWAAMVAGPGETEWRILAVETWRGTTGARTVPEAEAEGVAAASGLLNALLGKGDANASPGLGPVVPEAAIAEATRMLRAAWPATWPLGRPPGRN